MHRLKIIKDIINPPKYSVRLHDRLCVYQVWLNSGDNKRQRTKPDNEMIIMKNKLVQTVSNRS